MKKNIFLFTSIVIVSIKRYICSQKQERHRSYSNRKTTFQKHLIRFQEYIGTAESHNLNKENDVIKLFNYSKNLIENAN